MKYGDEVSLMGDNGKYFLVRYSGKITSRASVIARDTKFKIIGGSGGASTNAIITMSADFATFACILFADRLLHGAPKTSRFCRGPPC